MRAHAPRARDYAEVMKVRIDVDAPAYKAAAFTATADFLGIALDTTRQVRAALPVGDGVVLSQVLIGDDIETDTVTPATVCLAGGAAGALVATGILATSQLVSVWAATNIASDAGPPILEDLTDEFTVTDDDEIDNTGGTNTTGTVVIVSWVDVATV